jgi:hypothetical protein
MTTTVDLANLPSTPTDVAVNFMAFSSLAKTKEFVSANGLRAEASYVLASGDPTTPMTVQVSQRTDLEKGVVHSTISLTTIQTVTVDDVVTEVQPITVNIGVSAPGIMEDAADVLALIGSCYSLWFKTVTSKVPDAVVIGKINRGILASLYG